jgi:hypothetical protein
MAAAKHGKSPRATCGPGAPSVKKAAQTMGKRKGEVSAHKKAMAAAQTRAFNEKYKEPGWLS